MWVLIKKEARLLCGSGRRVVLTVFVISILGLLFAVALRGSESETQTTQTELMIGVVDLEQSALSSLVLRYVGENELFRHYISLTVATAADTLDAQLRTGELDLYLVLPEAFLSDMTAIRHTPLKTVLSGHDSTKLVLMKTMLAAYRSYISAVEVNCVALYDQMRAEGFSKELRDEVNDRISLRLITLALEKDKLFVRAQEEKYEAGSLQEAYGGTVLFLLLFLGASIAGLRLFSERADRTLARLISANVPMRTVLAAKLLVYGGLTALPLLLLGSLYARGTGMRVDAKVLLFLLLCAGCFVLLFLLFSLCFSRTRDYLLAVNLLLFAVLLIGGGIVPLALLPVSLVRIAVITPNYWFVKLLLQALRGETGLLLPVCAGLLVFLCCGCIVFVRTVRSRCIAEE